MSADDFVRRVKEARAVEVRGSPYLDDPDAMYLLDPNNVGIHADLRLPEAPLYVVCHRSREDEVREAVEGLRIQKRMDNALAYLNSRLSYGSFAAPGRP